jgi:VCBS repeat-containing protein
MKQIINHFIIGTVLGLSFISPLQAGVVDSELEAQLKTVKPVQLVSVIITLKSRANTNAIIDKDSSVRRRKMIQAMRNHSNLKHPALLTFLKANGATDIKPLWINNSIAAKIPAKLIRKLAKRPGVAGVYLDATLSVPLSGATTYAVPEWNLTAIHAPDLWAQGQSAQGVVVANMDTGVDILHPDLATRYRGGANSWFDPHGQNTTPTDLAGAVSGHGTQTMGLILGGDTGGTTIGTAPGAQWIAAKIFNNQGTAQESHFHLSFQWLLDPDNNPLTDDAPDVVNGSFQTALSGVCDTRFQADIQALKTAGISVVFAAGNSGPGMSSSSSPANNPGSFAAGAVDNLSAIAYFSARGPAPLACGGGLFPNIVAPGVDVITSDLTFAGMASYAFVSGTSFAAPHVAGGMALLKGSFPTVEVTALESALVDSATDLGAAGPDNEYGYGMLNVLAAYNILAAGGQNPVGVGDSYMLDEDTTLTVPVSGVLGNDSDPQNNPLTALPDTNVTHGTLVLNADGSLSYTPDNNYHGNDSFTYKATDGTNLSGAVTVVLTINPINDAPVAQADTATVSISASTAIPVLVNDSDPENSPLTPVIDSIPVNGTVSVNLDGTILYTHNGSQTVSDSFTYHVTDGDLSSNTVTVDLTVTPVTLGALPDSYNIAEDNALNVPAPGVLSNDSPSTGLSMQLVSGPAHAASFSANADGSFSYTPVADFGGTDSFIYKASDGAALTDNTTVTITVDPVNDAPVAVNDGVYTINAGQVLNVAAASGVLINDSDIENNTLGAVLASSPSAGSLTLNADGSFSFNATGVAAGTYSFSYMANDGMAANNLSNSATATITVIANTAPTANGDTFLFRPNVLRTVNVAGPLGSGVLMNDTDAENNALTAQYVAASLSGGGTLNFNTNGSFTYTKTTTASSSFRYLANDGILLSLPATGTTVNLRADAAPTTVADNCLYTISSNTATVPARCIVLANKIIKMKVALNDTDSNTVTNIPSDGIGKTVVVNSAVITAVGSGVNVLANAQCGQVARGTAPGARGTIINNCDGTVTVTVAIGNNVNAIAYSYKVSDDLGAQSSARSVTLSVQP